MSPPSAMLIGMSDPAPHAKLSAATYRVLVDGELDPSWSDWFDGFAMQLDGAGRTVLIGEVADQAALHGLLARLRDLALPLLGLCRMEPSADP